MLNASSRHSSPALLRGYSDEFNYSRNAPSACSGALILTSSNLLFGQGELQKQFSFTTMTLLCSQNEFSIWSILFSRTWISLFVKSWQFQEFAQQNHHHGSRSLFCCDLDPCARYHSKSSPWIAVTLCCDLDPCARWDFNLGLDATRRDFEWREVKT